jgi:hypothetical protein
MFCRIFNCKRIGSRPELHIKQMNTGVRSTQLVADLIGRRVFFDLKLNLRPWLDYCVYCLPQLCTIPPSIKLSNRRNKTLRSISSLKWKEIKCFACELLVFSRCWLLTQGLAKARVMAVCATKWAVGNLVSHQCDREPDNQAICQLHVMGCV